MNVFIEIETRPVIFPGDCGSIRGQITRSGKNARRVKSRKTVNSHRSIELHARAQRR
jgi:hypothetical protein